MIETCGRCRGEGHAYHDRTGYFEVCPECGGNGYFTDVEYQEDEWYEDEYEMTDDEWLEYTLTLEAWRSLDILYADVLPMEAYQLVLFPNGEWFPPIPF